MNNKREKVLVNITRNEREVTVVTADIWKNHKRLLLVKKIIYQKKHKLEEMGKFLEICNVSRVKQKEIENINRSITSNKIESARKQTPKAILSGIISIFPY